MAARVSAERDLLNRLDAALGDGDHGSSVSKALGMAARDIAALDEITAQGVWLTAAKALMNGMGGASGALFGTFFLRGAGKLRGLDTVSKADMAAALQAGLDGVQARGKAQIGDKTMVDALAPAVAAFADADGMESAWRDAADAAERGAESTRGLVARQGRAKYLGERAIGHRDPGATTIALMFAAAVTPLGPPAKSGGKAPSEARCNGEPLGRPLGFASPSQR